MAIQWAQIDLGVELSTISIYFFKSIPIDLMMKSLLRTCSCDKSPWSRSYLMNFIWKNSSETFLEIGYLLKIVDWWWLSQYLMNAWTFFFDGSQWSRSDLMKFLKFSSETFLEKGDLSKIVHKVSKNICLKMAWLDKDMKGFEIGVDDLRKELNSKLR